LAQDTYPCDHPVPIEQEPRHHLVIANDFVRVFAVEIAPHDRTLCHYHEREYLMYVAGDAQIVSAPRDGDPTTHSYHDGYCELSPPGLMHVVHNLGGTNFRPLIVELLAGMAGVPRGLDPKTVAGEANIARHFAENTASVFLLDVESESSVDICGPAVVASPYEHEVEVAMPQEGALSLAHYRHLFWLGPAARATLRGQADSAARAVLIAVGKS
jgi:hypothetical protein